MSAVGDQEIAATSAAGVRTGWVAVVAAWGPVAAWIALIFSLSSDQFSDTNTAAWLSSVPLVGAFGIPPFVIEVGNLIVRKCAHFVEYAVLGRLTARALWMRGWRNGRQVLMLALAIAMVCAGLDELHQRLGTLLRTGTPWDVALDAVGALAGVLVGVRVTRQSRDPT